MGNMNAIIAGEAYVRFYAPTQEFEQDNRKNEQSFKGAQERMWKEYVRKRFDYEKFMARERAREKSARRAEEKDIRDQMARMARWQQGVHEREQARTDGLRERDRQKRERDADRQRAEKRRVVEFSRNQDRLYRQSMDRERAREQAARRAEEIDIRDQMERMVRWKQGVHEREQARADGLRQRDRQQRERDANRQRAEKRRVIEFSRNQDRLYRQSREAEESRFQRYYTATQARAFAQYESRLRRQAVASERAAQQEQRRLQRTAQQEQRLSQQSKQAQESNLRTVTVGGLYLGDRMYDRGKQGLGGVLNSVREFGSIEQFMNQIRGSIRDNTNDIIGDMRRLEAQAYQLGEATEYDAVHIASAMDRMAIANASGSQISASLRPVIDVASIFSNPTTGKIMPDQASRTMLEVMNAQGKGFEWLPQLADKLAVAGRQADLTLENIGDALRYAGGTASEAGVEFDELLASLLVLDKRGQKGEMGGTAIRGIMASLLDPTDSAMQEYKSFGINIPTSGKLSIIDIIEQFEQKLYKLDEVQRAAVISKAFPNRQMTGVQLLMGASGQIREMMNLTENSQGKAAEIAGTKREGVAFALDVFDSAFQTLKASFGKTMAKDVATIAKELAAGMGWLARTFEAHPMLGRSLGLLAAGLVALAIPLSTIMTVVGGMAGMAMFANATQGLMAAGGGGGVAAQVVGSGLSAAASKGAATGVSSVVAGKAMSAMASRGLGAAAGTAVGTAVGTGAGAGTGFAVTKVVGSIVGSIGSAFTAALASPGVVAALAAALVVGVDHFFNDGKLWDGATALLANTQTAGSRAGFSVAPGSPEDLLAKHNAQFPNPYDPRRRTLESFQPAAVAPVAATVFGPREAQPAKTYPFGRPALIDMSIEDAMAEGKDEVLANLRARERVTAELAAAKLQQAEEAKALAHAAAVQFDASKDNPANQAAWKAFQALHPDLMDEGIRNSPESFAAYLRNYRKEEREKKQKATAPEKNSERAMAVLGDYNLRGQQGVNLVLDLLGNRRQADSAQTAKEMLAAQQRTATATEKMASGLGRGLKLGKGKA